MRTSPTNGGSPLVILLAIAAASSPLSGQDPIVGTTGSGVPHVSYPAIPDRPITMLQPDLVLGLGSEVFFGDIRGLEITSDSTILVLDHHASELWAFDLSGRHLETLFTRGEGPYEIAGGIGVRIDHEDAIWVNDPGNRRFTRLLPDGEVETVRRFIPGFGYRWIGGVTDDGRVWEWWAHADARSRGIPEPGLYQGSSRSYLKSLQPNTGETDSVLVGPLPVKQLNLPRGVIAVPFHAERLQAIAPSGTIWTALSDQYRLVQLSASGDTTLVLEVAMEQEPVSRAERAEEIARVEEFMQLRGRVSVDWDEAIPDHKPIIQHLVADDQGTIWVQRESDGATLFDRFSEEGRFLGHYQAPYVAHVWPPTVRNGWLIAVQVDDFDVQSIVGFRVRASTAP